MQNQPELVFNSAAQVVISWLKKKNNVEYLIDHNIAERHFILFIVSGGRSNLYRFGIVD